MSMHFKRRWDIYLNGADGVKHLMLNSLCAWTALFPVCGRFADALVEFITATVTVVGILVLPFFFWLAPFVALLTAHRIASDDEVRARMRKNIHQNGKAQ